jgi:secondary thiamine-phosphate synthase enzyme
MTVSLDIMTSAGDSMTDITSGVEAAVRNRGVREGLCLVSSPHTTAGITVNENADPDVRADMIAGFDRLIPKKGAYRHAEGNSAAHLKTALTGTSVILPISGGGLVLGTWQGIFFCDYDGPRRRQVIITILGQ